MFTCCGYFPFRWLKAVGLMDPFLAQRAVFFVCVGSDIFFTYLQKGAKMDQR